MAIRYVNGDVLEPLGEGRKVILHCCNDAGKWGSGFVRSISNKWEAPEQAYRLWELKNRLGSIQFVRVEDGLWVANMIGQHGVRSPNNPRPIRYSAILQGLTTANAFCKFKDASLHAPRFGSDRAGGRWELIEILIQEKITVPITIYTL